MSDLDKIKIIVIGEPMTGKSCFLKKWTEGGFYNDYTPSTISEHYFKNIEINGKSYKIDLLEIPGKGHDTDITKQFIKDTLGYIVMSDATKPETRKK